MTASFTKPMRNALFIAGAMLIAASCAPAHADTGLVDEVYGATVKAGEAEVELRYGRPLGGTAGPDDPFRVEAAYAFSDHFRLGVAARLAHDPGQSRKVTETALEAIWAPGKIGPVSVAFYGEYSLGIGEPDALEGKILLQHRRGPLDLRLNLIAAKPLIAGAATELSYAARTDYQVADDVRVGVEAICELGGFGHLFPRAAHYAGPVVAVELDHLHPELELSAGYLFTLGSTTDGTRGQLRLSLGFEF